MKKKILTIAVIVGAVIFIGEYAQKQFVPKKMSSLLSGNLEALADNDKSSFENGPQKKYDCAGWFTGNGYRCAAEIATNCKPIPCTHQ